MKKIGGLRVRKVELVEGGELLPIRRIGGASSFNFSLMTAISFNTCITQRKLPWSFVVNLTLSEVRLLAVEMLKDYPDTPAIVISEVKVPGETGSSGDRIYYHAAEEWLWDLCGEGASLHTFVERITRHEKT